MIKKIIAVMAALMCAVMLFNINAFAMTTQEYEQAILGLLYDLKNGYITQEQYEQYEKEVTTRFIESNTDGSGVVDTVADNISNTVKSITEGIGEAVKKTGDNFKNWLSDLFDDYETQENVSTTDKKGYKTMLHARQIGYNGKLTGAERYYYTNGYVVLYPDENKCLLVNNGYEYYTKHIDVSTGRVSVDTTGVGKENSYYTNEPGGWEFFVYGDVRYEDGSEAPTDDEFQTQDTIDFSKLTDEELDELLEDILEELERQNPDLSTIEGLLEAIYYRLGTLDSDNDNSILGEVVSAINSLKESIENIDISFNTDKEYNFEDLFGDIKFEIDFSDFFIDFEANISLYFKIEDGYFDTKLTDLKNDFDAEFAFINNISTYVKNIFDAFEALWEEE